MRETWREKTPSLVLRIVKMQKLKEDDDENDSDIEDNNDKWEVEGGVKESEKLEKPEESTKSEESGDTEEEGVSGEKVNENGTDIDNNSDEETK